MNPALASVLTPLLRLIDAETAHGLALRALRLGLAGSAEVVDPRFAVHAMGLSFRNPLGLAAGFDKNAEALAPLARLGFGFVEAGTVTPRPQAGNPKPRMFRLPAAHAIINRMGFNNGGVDAFVANVQSSRFYQDKAGVLGLNIGKNADTPIERAADDYLLCLQKVYPYGGLRLVPMASMFLWMRACLRASSLCMPLRLV